MVWKKWTPEGDLPLISWQVDNGVEGRKAQGEDFGYGHVTKVGWALLGGHGNMKPPGSLGGITLPTSCPPLLLFSASPTSLQIKFVWWLDHNVSVIANVSPVLPHMHSITGLQRLLHNSRNTPPQVVARTKKITPLQSPSGAATHLPVSCHAVLHAATCRFLAVAHPRTDVLSLAAELPANHR
jgi:hypothetical protein